MSGRRFSARTVRIAVRGVVVDILLVLLWRFGWGHSWIASLLAGAVMLALTAGVTVYAGWLDRHPDMEQRMRAKQLRKAERLAREVQASEASQRATGHG